VTVLQRVLRHARPAPSIMRNEQHAYRLGRRTSDRCPQRSSDAAGAICGKNALIVPLIQKETNDSSYLGARRNAAVIQSRIRSRREPDASNKSAYAEASSFQTGPLPKGAVQNGCRNSPVGRIRNHQLASGQGPPDTAVRQLRPPPFNSTNLTIDRNRRLAECTTRAGGQAASFCGVAMDHLAVRRVDRNSHN
jgi:hypothetical protein